MESTSLPPEPRGPGPHSADGIDSDAGRDLSWLVRHNTVLTLGAACVAPILYLLYINHYAVNSFLFDDYPPITLIGSAIHGHLTISALWYQFGEGRQFLFNIFFILIGLINRADVRSILFFSAAIYIASYFLLLALFRRYIRARLTPVPVLIMGLIWFSLADVGNSLFAYQLSLYLVVVFVIVMVFALAVPSTRRPLWLAIAVLAASAASLSFLNGFLAWPVGAICILWWRPWTRRTLCEIGVWIVSALCLAATYLNGYRQSQTGCGAGQHCSVSYSLAHPVLTFRVFLTLIGGVIPGGNVIPRISNGSYAPLPRPNSSPFEIVGAVVLCAALFIIIQSCRYRSTRERVPIPMFMICFALFWDGLTTLGRAGLGAASIVTINRYVMPNIILLTAIVMYGLAHVPPLRGSPAHQPRRSSATHVALLVLACFLVVQIAASTSFALKNGRLVHDSFVESARLWVNLDRVPARYRACEIDLVLNFGFFSGYPPPDAANDHLGEFRPGSFRHYRELGPPPLSPICTRRSQNPTEAPKLNGPGSAFGAARRTFAVPFGDGDAKVSPHPPTKNGSAATGYVASPYLGMAAQGDGV